MRKTWVKREHIYYKPFYKQKYKMVMLGVFLLAFGFFVYQVLSINRLSSSSNTPFGFVSTLYALKRKATQMIYQQNHKSPSNANFEGRSGSLDHEKAGEHELRAAPGAEAVNADGDIKIVRGTRLFDYDAYKPNFQGRFKCLDGSLEIAYERVNDDYCDCVHDGSDEPSTNACTNGRFYCRYQKRHITGRGRDVSVPSGRVNDGVCDCCDGSDEWGVKSIKCPNKCAL